MSEGESDGVPAAAPLGPGAEAELVTPSPQRIDPHLVRGMLLFVSGLLLLACMDSATKFLSARYEVTLIVAVRHIVSCLLMLALLAPSQGARLMQTRRTGLVLVRALCLAATSLLIGLALARMPVAESTSLVFLAPSFVVLLARPFLGERIGGLGWVAALAGFAGVLLIARPGAGLEPVGVAFAVAAAAVSAVYQLLSRMLAQSERTTVLMFYAALVSAITLSPAIPWFWDGRVPHLWDLLLFLGIAVASAGGHYLITAAHRYAPASILAPIGYVQLIWAGLLGWLVFGHVPAALSVLGMLVIIASGALIVSKPQLSAIGRSGRRPRSLA